MFKRFGLIHNCLIIIFCFYISIVIKRYIVDDELNFNLLHDNNGKVFIVIAATALVVYILQELVEYRKKSKNYSTKLKDE